MHGNSRNLVGLKFGKLSVVSLSGRKNGHLMWQCRCDCGVEKSVNSNSLVSGRQVSCGCHKAAKSAERLTRHGMTGTPEWKTWTRMTERCLNAENPKFKHYGGRGIKVCESWKSFEAFYSDMGNRPSASHSLDRIDVNGHYCKSNCRWATWTEQQNNRRNNLVIIWGGETRTAANWERHLGWPSHILSSRITRRGWSVQRAMTTTPRIR